MSLPDILLVEDNEDDVFLLTQAFNKANINNPLVHARDGLEALDYLKRRGRWAHREGAELPAVILLDINLPRMDGITVLKNIRADPALKHAAVVMLTSSNEEKDRYAAYDNHANSYICKPVDYDNFIVAAKQLGLYWLVLNRPAPDAPA